MNDLRLALLLVGALLVIGLVGWEFLQRRSARRAERNFIASAPIEDPLFDEVDEGVTPARDRVEPSISLDPVVDAVSRESMRDPLRAPPLVRIEEADGGEGGRAIPVIDPTASEEEFGAPTHAAAPVADEAVDGVTNSAIEPGASGPIVLQLVWPPEHERVILGLRIVGRNGEKLTGGSLRQALLGEGFLHGELDIFHRPIADGRVIFSAASLTRPGNFDLSTMDAHLYLGLNLFAMLPGALPPDEMFDRLIDTAQRIAQRVRGELHDSKGNALADTRIAELRREVLGANS